MKKQIPIPKEHRRGNDRRTDTERKQAGRKQRKARTEATCHLCEKLGRRGWAKGLCTKCAKDKGYTMPQKQKTRSHHKKKAKPNKRSAEGVVKKELSEDGNANHYPGTEFDKPEVKVKMEQKIF